MGREFAEKNSDAMRIWKKAEHYSKLALREIYWDGDESAMTDTRALQPALTAANLCIWTELAKKLKPACAAGHSLGEYSALAAAGALSLDAVLELVALRGRLMAEADPLGKGSMAAILRLSRAEAEACVAAAQKSSGEMLLIANYNTPEQCVASGTKASIAVLQDTVREYGGRALPLAVSGAFHSPMMEEAAKEMESALRKASWHAAKFPVYTNVAGKSAYDAEDLRKLLSRQMTSSVLWTDVIVSQWQGGVRRFVECGPKNVLTKMLQPILKTLSPPPDTAAYCAVSVSSRKDMDIVSF